ncbi:MAG: hypothetical protein JW951_10205 [Lentisphaerae bacterium]|nr:hypothetical protein [Lentisphaerota bacterium]
MPGVSLLEALTGRLVLPVALILNPLLLVRCLLPSLRRETLPLAAALACLVLNAAVPVTLHLAGIPIAPRPLAAVHLFVAAAGLPVLRRLRRPAMLPGGLRLRAEAGLWLLLAVLVFPFAHLSGYDAYKWGDLAAAVAVERAIPWLVHPLSLFGFTPRSYPSLHPLLMGSIRALGATGIETSFYLASLVIAATAVAAARYLARSLGFNDRDAFLFAAFYALSPVFVRYIHWGTGRGLFLAVLPAFLAALAALPRPRAWAPALLTALLLALSHRTGLVAAVLLPAVRLAAPLWPRRRPAWCLALLLAAAALSLAFAPGAGLPGRLSGVLRSDLARFAWMSPAVLAAAVRRPRRLFAPDASGFMWVGLLVCFPAAHDPRFMYPALLGLPFLVYAAHAAIRAVPRPAAARTLARTALALSLCGALAVVVRRSLDATPDRIYRAARFIEAVDPYGPFEIVSARWRSRIQGLVTGSPRFTVSAAPRSAVRVAPPPGFPDAPRAWIRDWTRYLRAFLSIDAAADWYGSPRRRYVIIDRGDGVPPPDGVRLYDRDGVTVYRVTLP